MNEEQCGSNMLHIIMKQYSLKTVLIKFQEQGEALVTKELIKLHVLEKKSQYMQLN